MLRCLISLYQYEVSEICEEVCVISSWELAQAGSNMLLVCLHSWLWQPSESNGSCLISMFQIFYTFHFWPALTPNHLGKRILGILFLAQHISLDWFLQFDLANKFSNIIQIQVISILTTHSQWIYYLHFNFFITLIWWHHHYHYTLE